MKNETALGALIAAAIGFLTGMIALLNQEGVESISMIGDKAWIILAAGAAAAFLKDYQAISTRRALARMTKSGNLYSHWILAVILSGIVLGVSGCAGTRDAYQATESPGDTAKVVAEHYYALVREANAMRAAGTLAGADLAAAQDLVRSTAPSIEAMAAAAGAFEAGASAQTQAELDAAVTQAAAAVSKLIAILDKLRSSYPDPPRAIAGGQGDDSDPAPPEDWPPESVPLEDDPPLRKAA